MMNSTVLREKAREELGRRLILRRQAREELRRRHLARTTLEGFTTYTYQKYIVEPFHALVCTYLDAVVEGYIRRLMIFAPPQHGKSELVSVRLPAYWLGRRPDDPIMLGSYSSDMAHDKSGQARAIVESEDYKIIFPDTKTSRTSRAVDKWNIEGSRGYLLAAGWDGPMGGRGGKLGIIDDPFKDWEQSQSKTIRDKVWNWWGKVFYPRIWEGGAIVIITTRWDKDDLVGRLLNLGAEKWDILRFPAIAEEPHELRLNNKRIGLAESRPDHIGRLPGERLCPVRYSQATMELFRKNAGPIGWPALYQGIPSEAEGAVFKRLWFEARFQNRSDHYVFPSGAFVFAADCERFAIVDPAASEKQTADFTSIGVYAAPPSGDLILLEMVRERFGLEGIVPALARTCRQWRPSWVGVEANGFQVGVQHEAEKHDDIPTVMPLSPEGKGKLVRAHPAIILASQGRVWLPDRGEWVDGFLERLVEFTGMSDEWDDEADNLAYAVLCRDAFGGQRTAQPYTAGRPRAW